MRRVDPISSASSTAQNFPMCACAQSAEQSSIRFVREFLKFPVFRMKQKTMPCRLPACPWRISRSRPEGKVLQQHSGTVPKDQTLLPEGRSHHSHTQDKLLAGPADPRPQIQRVTLSPDSPIHIPWLSGITRCRTNHGDASTIHCHCGVLPKVLNRSVALISGQGLLETSLMLHISVLLLTSVSASPGAQPRLLAPLDGIPWSLRPSLSRLQLCRNSLGETSVGCIHF